VTCEAAPESAAWVPSVEQNVARFDDPMIQRFSPITT